jgi:hypothetical protein
MRRRSNRVGPSISGMKKKLTAIPPIGDVTRLGGGGMGDGKLWALFDSRIVVSKSRESKISERATCGGASGKGDRERERERATKYRGTQLRSAAL